jgi:hypothetical protein
MLRYFLLGLLASSAPAATLPLIELFTSEGCSSCPPADRLLAKLDQEGAAIVLSEHVDYWNQLGWSDPFSSSWFSQRQQRYAQRFKNDGPYTPQAVVNGEREVVGNQERDLRALIAKAKPFEASIEIAPPVSDGKKVTATIDVAGAPKGAEVWVVVAQREARVPVQRGENRGATLTHVSVVRKWKQAGAIRNGEPGHFEVSLPVDPSWKGVRLVAWIQEPQQGRVLGAAQKDIPAI